MNRRELVELGAFLAAGSAIVFGLRILIHATLGW